MTKKRTLKHIQREIKRFKRENNNRIADDNPLIIELKKLQGRLKR